MGRNGKASSSLTTLPRASARPSSNMAPSRPAAANDIGRLDCDICSRRTRTKVGYKRVDGPIVGLPPSPDTYDRPPRLPT